MFLFCCHRRLTVLVSDDLRDEYGKPTLGLFDPVRKAILLDRGVPRDQRREVLIHEYGHAYDYYVGRPDPSDAEGRQNRIATMSGELADSLDAACPAGGDSAIHELFGDAEEDGYSPDALGELAVVPDDDYVEWPTVVSCPHCHETFTSRMIRNGKPAFDPQRDAFAMWRLLTCHHCDRIVRWRQMSTHDGLPLPKTIVPPTSRPIELHHERHP
jgi:hypothetical protein